MNPLAEQLNETIKEVNSHVFEMLSELGENLFFPKGILAQTTEAKEKANKHNATIGIAKEGSQAMYLPSMMNFINGLNPNDVFDYAPSTGKLELREKWLEGMVKKNPTLKGKEISLPLVTSALTHGLSVVGDIFVDPDDVIIIPDKFWENYRLIFTVRKKAKFKNYSLFAGDRFNIGAFEEAVSEESRRGKVIILFNFPNNPTGYSITRDEATAIVNVVKKVADGGCNVVAILDDAYFGLFYEDEVMRESLFAYLADLDPRILAVKLDGITKEDYTWGFRVGFITYGVGGGGDRLYQALEKKTAGAVRGSVSNVSHLSQSIALKAMGAETYSQEKREKYKIMKERADKVKEVLKNPKYKLCWQAYPFNSGYFMCLRLKSIDAEELRKYLLDRYGVGVISGGKTDLRIAFSCVDKHEIEDLFETIFKAAQELERGK